MRVFPFELALINDFIIQDVTSVRVGVQARTVSALLLTTAVSDEMPKHRTSWNTANMWIHIHKLQHAGVGQDKSRSVNRYSHFWGARWCSAGGSWKAPSTVCTALGSACGPGVQSMCAGSRSSAAHSWSSLQGKRRRGIDTCASWGIYKIPPQRVSMYVSGWMTYRNERLPSLWTDVVVPGNKLRCAGRRLDLYVGLFSGNPLVANRDTKWEIHKAKRQVFFLLFFFSPVANGK